MKRKIAIILLISLLWAHYVNAQTDSLRLNRIDSTLREYGHQQTVANKISIVSVICVVGGTILGIEATPLLIITSLCDLTTIFVSNKANKRLSKHGKR